MARYDDFLEIIDTSTISQVFAVERHFGGRTELRDACRQRALQKHIFEHGIAFASDLNLDPAAANPKWAHPRVSNLS
jgi:hypothetical protein